MSRAQLSWPPPPICVTLSTYKCPDTADLWGGVILLNSPKLQKHGMFCFQSQESVIWSNRTEGQAFIHVWFYTILFDHKIITWLKQWSMMKTACWFLNCFMTHLSEWVFVPSSRSTTAASVLWTWAQASALSEQIQHVTQPTCIAIQKVWFLLSRSATFAEVGIHQSPYL